MYLAPYLPRPTQFSQKLLFHNATTRQWCSNESRWVSACGAVWAVSSSSFAPVQRHVAPFQLEPSRYRKKGAIPNMKKRTLPDHNHVAASRYLPYCPSLELLLLLLLCLSQISAPPSALNWLKSGTGMAPRDSSSSTLFLHCVPFVF